MRRVILRKVSAGLIGLSMLIAACGQNGAPAAPAPAVPPGEAQGKAVQLTAAQKQFLTIQAVSASQEVDVLMLPGRMTFRPQAQSAVGAAVAGRVAAVLVRAGQVVKAGTPLVQIDSSDAAAARAALEQAATRLAAAEAVYRRNVEMVSKGVGIESERQEAEARLKEARTEHERARQGVNLIGSGQGMRATVRAPSNGVVMAIRVTVGATVVPGGEALLELGDPSQLQVVALVPDSDLARIAVGQEAEVELPALSTRVTARVETLNPRIEAESRRSQVYLALAKRVDGLRAGMLAQIALKTSAEKGISVPVSAVLIKDGRRRVVYVERPDGNFEPRDVQTGRIREGKVVILRGLATGDRIVVRGALLLDSQAEQLL